MSTRKISNAFRSPEQQQQNKRKYTASTPASENSHKSIGIERKESNDVNGDDDNEFELGRDSDLDCHIRSPIRIFSSGSSSSSSSGQQRKKKLVIPYKWFNDPIYEGGIKFEPITLKIIDSPQFQRLHGLKQLGACDYVFRSANHTRFSHSLGVAHLAEKVAKTLQTEQPYLGITDKDILCVKIAGLCHDLGHGPFSHVFDGVFVKKMHGSKGIDGRGKHWKHEDGSIAMLRYLLRENGLQDVDGREPNLLLDFGLSEVDQTFIEEIIAGASESQRVGRPPEKFYLYDIVNNNRSGLDVDKLDYFQRDIRMTNVSVGPIDFNRFINLGRALAAEPIENRPVSLFGSISNSREESKSKSKTSYPMMICYPEKLLTEGDAYRLFATRYHMHKSVYTHKAVKQVEFMITDALELANDHIRISGTKTRENPDGLYKLSEAIYDMNAFSKLKDSILDVIFIDPRPELDRAKALISRIYRRELYTFIGKLFYTTDMSVHKISEEQIIREIVELANSTRGPSSPVRSSNDPFLSLSSITAEHTADNLIVDENNEDSQLSQASQLSQYSQPVEPYSHSIHLALDSKDSSVLTAADIIIDLMHVHHGKKEKDPVQFLRFFSKDAREGDFGFKGDESSYSWSLPRVFEMRAVRVFCRFTEKHALAKKGFELWSRSHRSNNVSTSSSNANRFAPSSEKSNRTGFYSLDYEDENDLDNDHE